MAQVHFLTSEEVKSVESAAASAAVRSSAAVRIFIAMKSGKNPLRDAMRAYEALGLKEKGGVSILFYVSVRDKKIAVFGGDSVNEKAGEGFWEKIKGAVIEKFKEGDFAIGLIGGINMAVEKLAEIFPAEEGMEAEGAAAVFYSPGTGPADA